MDPEIIHHAGVNHTDDEDNSVYSSGMVPDMMWKIREDCEKLMNSYNESSEGKSSLPYYIRVDLRVPLPPILNNQLQFRSPHF